MQKEPSADSTLIINEAFEVYPIRIWEKSFIEKIHHKVITKLQWREDVWQFVLKNTAEIRNHAVLGIHIRKTDHSNELKPSPLEDYFTQIDRLLPSYTKLFVATDYKDVLETMRQKYLDKIIFHVAHRSRGTVAVHTMHNLLDRYQLGLEALLDCYSLSLCKKTIRSPSNLSYEACLFKTMTEARLTPNSMLAQSERHGVRVASGNRQRPEMVLSQMMEVLEIAVLYV